MTDLKALLERVEKAEGPDRKLDILIWEHMDADPKLYRRVVGKPRYSEWESKAGGRWHDFYPSLNVSHYTASLDASLALVERALPGWGIQQITWPLKPKDNALFAVTMGNFGKAHDYKHVMGEGRQPQTAALSALIRAKMEME